MKLWEVWDAFKAGKPVKSESQKTWMKFVEYDEDYGGPCILDENGCYDNIVGIELGWMDAEDWEVVPEPKKHVRWLNLDIDGHCGAFKSKEEADDFAHPDRIECRRIEWEASE